LAAHVGTADLDFHLALHLIDGETADYYESIIEGLRSLGLRPDEDANGKQVKWRWQEQLRVVRGDQRPVTQRRVFGEPSFVGPEQLRHSSPYRPPRGWAGRQQPVEAAPRHRVRSEIREVEQPGALKRAEVEHVVADRDRN
jgi:hypothetical protein